MMTPLAKPIRIMLVETQQIVLWALEKLIEVAKPRMEVVAKASSGAEAVLLASQTQPDIVLLDICVDDGKGADVVASIVSGKCTRVIIYTAERDLDTVDRAILNGARGLVLKEQSTDTLLSAISRVHAGQVWLNQEITSRIFTEFVRPAGRAPVDSAAALIASLTPKELSIMRTFAKYPDYQISKISGKLFISQHTMRNHLTSIFAKLDVTNRCGMCGFIKRNGHVLQIVLVSLASISEELTNSLCNVI